MANTKICFKPKLHQLRIEEELMQLLDSKVRSGQSRNGLIIELIHEALENRA